MADRVCVGAIAGAFGVKGEVRIKSFCAEPADIATYGPLTSQDGARSFDIKLTRAVKQGFAARINGVTSKENAESLRGLRLYAPRAALPHLPEDEFYHTDLIGLTAFDTGGEMIGKVAAVLNHGASDLLEIRGTHLKQPVLVPFTKDIVPMVDVSVGRIVIDAPDGLLD
jgi:16S rRNA processing protein RimM